MFAAKMYRSNLHLYIHIQVCSQGGQTGSVKTPSQVLKKDGINREVTYPSEYIQVVHKRRMFPPDRNQVTETIRNSRPDQIYQGTSDLPEMQRSRTQILTLCFPLQPIQECQRTAQFGETCLG
jgi:hypothetical protein